MGVKWENEPGNGKVAGYKGVGMEKSIRLMKELRWSVLILSFPSLSFSTSLLHLSFSSLPRPSFLPFHFLHSLSQPLVKSFLPMLQEQFLQIKFPPMADVADLGADVVEYSTGEVRFKELIVPEDKVGVRGGRRLKGLVCVDILVCVRMCVSVCLDGLDGISILS